MLTTYNNDMYLKNISNYCIELKNGENFDTTKLEGAVKLTINKIIIILLIQVQVLFYLMKLKMKKF